jgi:asparagine synthase (glutamine-hydrolysing)
MCGFAGLLGGSSVLGEVAQFELTKRMTDTVVRRGPDDSGYWVDSFQRIGLGHRRLSIVDLSQNGHQPMVSSNGRYVLTFNGEIYNHLDLRKELEKISNALPIAFKTIFEWRGQSDTETLLAGIEAWGFEATIMKSIGMFSIALWDRETNSLTLARDRMGEKPLYYGWQGSGDERVFLFGSELKALKAHPAFSSEIDRGALSLLLRHNYIPAPYSIYKGIAKLEPGSLLSVSLRQPEPKLWKYWDSVEVAVSGLEKQFPGTAHEAANELEILVKDAVRQQMVADVPLGAFLSGGVDSSTIVALMQAQSSRAVKTFTIGFSDKAYNEATFAKNVAQHLGTEHTELYITAHEAMKAIALLPSLYCEPFSDPSQIPTVLLSKLTRQHVTVALSGDGGDELFCGYNRYFEVNKIWRRISNIPKPLRSFASGCITSLSPTSLDSLERILPRLKRDGSLGAKMHRRAKVLASRSVNELYIELISHVQNPADWVIDGKEPITRLTSLSSSLDGLDNFQRLMALDMVSYLPDDILVKIDRAAMSVSLEGRVPFLDHRIVEFAGSLPTDYKFSAGQAKWPLRQVLCRYVPMELIDRPKMGFGVPLQDWLRGPLFDWAESLLDESRLNREGYFRANVIRRKWAEHLSGKYDWSSQLWSVLMFQAWLENNFVASKS